MCRVAVPLRSSDLAGGRCWASVRRSWLAAVVVSRRLFVAVALRGSRRRALVGSCSGFSRTLALTVRGWDGRRGGILMIAAEVVDYVSPRVVSEAPLFAVVAGHLVLSSGPLRRGVQRVSSFGSSRRSCAPGRQCLVWPSGHRVSCSSGIRVRARNAPVGQRLFGGGGHQLGIIGVPLVREQLRLLAGSQSRSTSVGGGGPFADDFGRRRTVTGSACEHLSSEGSSEQAREKGLQVVFRTVGHSRVEFAYRGSFEFLFEPAPLRPFAGRGAPSFGSGCRRVATW